LTTNMVKSLIKTIDFSTCKFTPDPTVDGVWKVDLKSGHTIIAYLKGYKDPWGQIRDINDFETDLK
jgi:hypothetical protein